MKHLNSRTLAMPGPVNGMSRMAVCEDLAAGCETMGVRVAANGALCDAALHPAVPSMSPSCRQCPIISS